VRALLKLTYGSPSRHGGSGDPRAISDDAPPPASSAARRYRFNVGRHLDPDHDHHDNGRNLYNGSLKSDFSLLHFAAKSGDLPMVRLLLETLEAARHDRDLQRKREKQIDADVSLLQEALLTTATTAASADDEKLRVQNLVRARTYFSTLLREKHEIVKARKHDRTTQIDFRQKCTRHGWTPMHFAAHEGEIDIINALAAAGEARHVHARGRGGDTPLDLARRRLADLSTGVDEEFDIYPGAMDDWYTCDDEPLEPLDAASEQAALTAKLAAKLGEPMRCALMARLNMVVVELPKLERLMVEVGVELRNVEAPTIVYGGRFVVELCWTVLVTKERIASEFSILFPDLTEVSTEQLFHPAEHAPCTLRGNELGETTTLAEAGVTRSSTLMCMMTGAMAQPEYSPDPEDSEDEAEEERKKMQLEDQWRQIKLEVNRLHAYFQAKPNMWLRDVEKGDLLGHLEGIGDKNLYHQYSSNPDAIALLARNSYTMQQNRAEIERLLHENDQRKSASEIEMATVGDYGIELGRLCDCLARQEEQLRAID
jgi:ankyrin repeat protein